MTSLDPILNVDPLMISEGYERCVVSTSPGSKEMKL